MKLCNFILVLQFSVQLVSGQNDMVGMVDSTDGHMDHKHVYTGDIKLIGAGQDQQLGYSLNWNTYAKNV